MLEFRNPVEMAQQTALPTRQPAASKQPADARGVRDLRPALWRQQLRAQVLCQQRFCPNARQPAARWKQLQQEPRAAAAAERRQAQAARQPGVAPISAARVIRPL